MADYQIEIDMSEETVDALDSGNFVLYGFKGVRTTLAGAPLVWFQSTNFATNTYVDWTVDYETYTFSGAIIPGGVIRASNHYPTELGSTLNVTSDKGTGSVVQEGTSGALSIHNLTNKQFTCGISQKQFTGASTPMCAFPLYGQHVDVIAPIERVLLMFSSMAVNTGTVIEKAYSPGILVDLTGARNRTVSYDINAGWSWGSAPWGRAVPANAKLVPLLVEATPDVLDEPVVPGAREPGAGVTLTAGTGVPATAGNGVPA
ncbi:hypothetical protein AB0L41_45390 [Amycolatopsis mediterranei]|uniref:hypothetical protein n=1 Tax=Amycolatopsis mediterranei TaxID=33910 RepID=UPI003414DA7C